MFSELFFQIYSFRPYLRRYNLDMRHIQYQGETLPPFPLVLAFHLVLGKFHIYINRRVTVHQMA